MSRLDWGSFEGGLSREGRAGGTRLDEHVENLGEGKPSVSKTYHITLIRFYVRKRLVFVQKRNVRGKKGKGVGD